MYRKLALFAFHNARKNMSTVSKPAKQAHKKHITPAFCCQTK